MVRAERPPTETASAAVPRRSPPKFGAWADGGGRKVGGVDPVGVRAGVAPGVAVDPEAPHVLGLSSSDGRWIAVAQEKSGAPKWRTKRQMN